jgi:hypothetical protein
MDSNIDKIKIQRAMVVFKRMSPGNQLPLLREMHAATPLNTQNGMLNEAIAVGSNVFKMGVASYILSVEPVANYVKCAEKFIEAAESLSDILFKIHDAAECHGQKEKAVATSTEMIKSASTLSVLISPAKKRKSEDFSFSESIKPNKDEDDDDDDDYELNDNGKKHASLNHGALTLHTENETANEFADSSFIVRVNEKDTNMGFNMSYCLVSIFNWAQTGYELANLASEVENDLKKITMGTMTKLWDRYNVVYQRINTSYEDIITGDDHSGDLIVMVYEASRYQKSKESADNFPETWIHFCLFFQKNGVFLTFNQLNRNYKMGKIVNTKKEDGFDKYMERNVHKKICPVVRNDERSYNLERKMRFMQAFIVQKGPL